MGLAEASIWTIDSIQSSAWKTSNDFANIEISNYAGDYIRFQVLLTPDEDIVPFNTQSDMSSENWYLHTTESDAIKSVLDETQSRLASWQAEIDISVTWVEPKRWDVLRGHSVNESVWAGLAYLFELRASMNEPKIVEMLAADMKTTVPKAKERIRKARDKEFLSLVGKGKNTQAVATKKAIRILEKEGLLK